MLVQERTPTPPAQRGSSRRSRPHGMPSVVGHDASLRPAPNADVWVMTPGRGDIFAFLMRGGSGFIFPWPRARARQLEHPKRLSKAEKSSMGSTDELGSARAVHTPTRLDGDALGNRTAWWSTPLRAVAARPRGLPALPAWSAWSPPLAIDGELYPTPTPLRSDLVEIHPTLETSYHDALDAAQRLAVRLRHHVQYVIPVTLHPDLELTSESDRAALSSELLEPHVHRVGPAHSLLAWDRHYREPPTSAPDPHRSKT